jgi:hypothetical protein
MIKFTLIIWVCSFAGNPAACLPPLEYPKHFNSWYECSRTAHTESAKMLSKLGYKYVNNNKIGMKYSCKITQSI